MLQVQLNKSYTSSCLWRYKTVQYLVSGAAPENPKKNLTFKMAASKKDPILDLGKYLDQPVRVKFQGGREVNGTLKGFDALVNIVLDDCVEYVRDATDHHKLTEETRTIGLVVCRGTSVMLISPVDGSQEIANPFIQQEE